MNIASTEELLKSRHLEDTKDFIYVRTETWSSALWDSAIQDPAVSVAS